MKHILIISLVFAALTSIFAQNSANIEAVSQTFSQFKSAMAEGRGDSAASYLSQGSLDYYTQILDHTLRASEATVRTLSIVDKTTILGARHQLTLEVARGLNAITFFKYAIESDLIGKDLIGGLEIANIEVTDRTASAQVLTAGTELPVKLGFNSENGQWKIDITSIYPATNKLLENIITMLDQDEDAFVFNLIMQNTGETPTDAVWRPLEK